LLSADARRKRMIRMDNIKTLRLSWADLEGLITSPEISGKALYRGEGCRPNTFTVTITLNGASLSKDLAQRSIPIQAARPKFASEWEQNVLQYIDTYRWEILSDIGYLLEVERGSVVTKTRWSAWEQHVLSKTNCLVECQALIVERQKLIDDDEEERANVAEYFIAQLVANRYEPSKAHIVIPSRTLAEWLSAATNSVKKYATNTASTHMKTLAIPQLTYHRQTNNRAWIWKGEDAGPGEPKPFIPYILPPFVGRAT
jgi:hypothetical protein